MDLDTLNKGDDYLYQAEHTAKFVKLLALEDSVIHTLTAESIDENLAGGNALGGNFGKNCCIERFGDDEGQADLWRRSRLHSLMSAIAAALQKAALKGFNKLGGEVTIRYVTAGDYDVTTGTIPDFSTTVETHEVKGVLRDVNVREVNELVQAGDKRLMPAVELPSAPETKDRVTITALSIRVFIRVETIEQANTPIVYVLAVFEV